MVNYKNWSLGEFFIFSLIILIIGMFIPIRKVEVPVEKRVEVVKEIPAQCDYSEWKNLKVTDDWGITYCKVGFELASEGFTALGKADQKEIQRILKDMKDNNQKISETSDQRQSILNKLGY